VAARSPLAGRWIMPDGSIRQGTRVTYTGAAGDEERIRYEAWIDGYHAETARIVEQPVRIRTYTWPNWRLYSNILFPYTPARVAYELKPDGALDPRASTSVDWTLPPGAVLERDDGTQITLRFDTPGAWTVEGRVADTMGHSSALSETVEIQTAPPLSASLETAVVDSWSRAPADVITRWQVSGLLAGERIVQLSLRFNDAVVSQKLANALRTRVGEPGTYTVEVDLTSNAGRTVTASHVIELFAGDPPQCTIHVLGDAGRSLEAQAMCKAKTGMLTKYHWWIQYADADAPHDLGYRGSRIRLPASALARGIEAITLVGVNDLHQESEPFSWSPETEHEAPVEASP
jgi:hypothetical protein